MFFAQHIHTSSFIVCSCQYTATKISLHKTFKRRIFQFDRKLSTLTHPFLALPSRNSIKIITIQVTLAWLSSASVTQPPVAPHSLLQRTLLAQTSLQTRNELTELLCRNTTSTLIDKLSSHFTGRGKLMSIHLMCPC
jgi:hypothetical protein